MFLFGTFDFFGKIWDVELLSRTLPHAVWKRVKFLQNLPHEIGREEMCVKKQNMKQVMAGSNFTIFNHIQPTFDGGPMLFLLFFCLKCLVLFFDATAFSSMGITSPQEQHDCECLLCLSCRYMLSLHRRRHEGRRLILVAGFLGSGCVSSVKSCATNPAAAALRWKRVAYTVLDPAVFWKRNEGQQLEIYRPHCDNITGI